MTESELKLVELDPNKYYVVMFKGGSADLMWPDKPANVSDVMLDADSYTIEDIDKATAALPNNQANPSADGTDAKGDFNE